MLTETAVLRQLLRSAQQGAVWADVKASARVRKAYRRGRRVRPLWLLVAFAVGIVAGVLLS